MSPYSHILNGIYLFGLSPGGLSRKSTSLHGRADLSELKFFVRNTLPLDG